MNTAFRTLLSTLLMTTLFSVASHGQARPRTGKAPQPAAARELAVLLAAQQKALDSGDARGIEAATRPLAANLLRQMSQWRLVEGDAADAVALARRSLALVPLAETRLEVASMLIRMGHPKEAAEEAASVLASDPRSAAAWAIRGSALRASGDDRGAVEAFNHSLAIQPEMNVAYALASSLLAMHELAKAQTIFSQILKASGDGAIQHVAAGDAYREAQYLPEAVAEFKKALAIDPRVGHAEFFLGYTYLQMNEWGPDSQSLEHLRAAARLAPHEYLSNFYLGAIESTVGSDLASSDRHLHVAAEADPRAPEAWLYLGLNAVRERHTEEAKTYLRKAIEVTGSDEARNNYQIRRVYAVLGRILVSEGNHEEGDALLAKYKSSEHHAISDSASFIAKSAGEQNAHADANAMAVGKVSFPGMSSPELPGLGGEAALPAPTATPTVVRSAEESRRMEASKRQLSELLASSFNDLGTAEARQERYEDALAHFQEAEHWGTPSPELLHNIGAAAFRVGNFAEAARALRLYLDPAAKQPMAAEAKVARSRMMLAMSLFSLGEFAEADVVFAQIQTLAMQDARAAYSWAYSLAHTGQQQHANAIAAQLAEQPLPSDVASLVCHIYMDTEDYEHSLTCYRNAYSKDPSLTMAHYQAGESLIRLDRPAEAVPELRQEMALEPENPDVRYSLAFALLQSGQRADAMHLLEALTASTPTHAQAQYQLGKALLEDGKTSEAIGHLEQACASDPAPDYIHYQLQAAYRKAGRTADADRELKIYREIKARSREGSEAQPRPAAK
ncbi:MAG: tetratricopeptide repeat protein [Acidobacteriota bacterium]|nr:tetratricopeptide repeat protein [Acidobacteriota bacterium]